MSVNIAYNWSLEMSQDVVIPIFGKKVDEEFVKRFVSISWKMFLGKFTQKMSSPTEYQGWQKGLSFRIRW